MTIKLEHMLANYPLESLLQTIPTGIFLVDTDMKIVYWNHEAERITGYSAAEAVGQKCTFLTSSSCEDGCLLYHDDVEKPNIGLIGEILHKNGKVLTLSKNVDLLHDKDGRIIGGIESFVDISRLKTLENNLRSAVAEKTEQIEREKAGLRAVLDGMVDPAFISDDQYNIVFTNRAMREITDGFESGPCFKVLYGKEHICSDCTMPTVMQGEIVRETKVLDGSGRIFEIVHSPYPEVENPTHMLSVCRDLTERIESERRLSQANRELDAFVSTVSHDLRSPLTPLIGFAELLEERYASDMDDIGKECIKEIQKTGERMKALLEDLLSLSRVGQLKSPERPIDVTAIAHEVVLELADKILEKKAKIKIETLPSVCIPETLLNDLFHNLLENALKYAAPVDPHVEVRGQQIGDGRARFQVIDHGPGIPQEEWEEVFEPFKRGSGSHGVPGTGIGLATVAKIARVFGGSAWVSNTSGGGAIFNVILALKADPD
jgi:PAS domain S-box-containing protein